MGKYYDKLLMLCGFEDAEINKERVRIEETFRRLELKPEDMITAEAWVRQNHDIELRGVRKILRIWLKELFDLVLAKDEGKKLVYFGFPGIEGPSAAIAAASDNIFCICPDAVVSYCMGQIFNKVTPILEVAERNGLPPGHSLCSLQQVRLGGMVKGIIPVADMVLTSSYYCDMGTKNDELIHERFGHPAVYIDGSMDSRWGEFPHYFPERVTFLGGELDKALDKVKEILGVEVTEEARHKGASRNIDIGKALNKFVTITGGIDPQPISIVESHMMRMLAAASAGKWVMTEAADAINLLNVEVQERIDRGIGINEKGAPKVAILFIHFADPSITRMMEKSGLAITTALTYLMAAKYRPAPPIVSGKLVAEAVMHNGMFYGSYGLIKRAAEAVEGVGLDGIIWNYLYNCRPLTQMSHLFKQYIEKETGIPVLSLESDLVDNRTYSKENLRTKVETFAEMLRARQATIQI